MMVAQQATYNGTFETWELQVGDLCIYVGDEKTSQLKNRLVYQVMSKIADPNSSYSHNRYTYRVAFDLSNPCGTELETTTGLGTRGIKKLSLVDLGLMRMCLDTFIQNYVKSRTGEAENERSGDGQDGAALATTRVV